MRDTVAAGLEALHRQRLGVLHRQRLGALHRQLNNKNMKVRDYGSPDSMGVKNVITVGEVIGWVALAILIIWAGVSLVQLFEFLKAHLEWQIYWK